MGWALAGAVGCWEITQVDLGGQCSGGLEGQVRKGGEHCLWPGLAWLSQEGPLGPTCAFSLRSRLPFALRCHLGAPTCHVACHPQKLTLKYSLPHFPAPTGGGQGRKRCAAETQLRSS